MAKWYGQIGFAITKETDLDVWTEEIIEHNYYGDVLRNNKSNYANDEINSGFNISNRISFIADPFARENIYRMKYATFMGTKWNITSVEVDNYPRIVVSLGGLWNGEKPQRPI